jgi:hypothetical protein
MPSNKKRSSPSGPVTTEKVEATIADTLIATITTAEVSVTVAGLKTTDVVNVSCTTALPAGLGLAGARVSAANTLTLAFVNPTAGGIQTTALVFNVNVARYST